MRDKLRQQRTNKNLTQEQLGKKINRTRTTISMYESGNATPPFKIALEIKSILEYQSDDLFENS